MEGVNSKKLKRSRDFVSSEDNDSLLKQHLGWTSKQGHILTGGGMAEEFYSVERGLTFEQNELPHHYLMTGESHREFRKWRRSSPPCSLVAGVWNRPLFVGGWHHSTDQDEIVYNIQTHNLFIDLRIPKSRDKILKKGTFSSLEDLGPSELRCFARQHIFAGFSKFSEEKGLPLCTRHHVIDWNFVGAPRTRPNKWWIEMHPEQNMWKEHSYATNDRGQYYYSERWERINDYELPRLALRKAETEPRDGIIVAIGDHFNFVSARDLVPNKYPKQKSLVDLVDTAIAAGDMKTAISYLSIEGGHGIVSDGWRLDCAIRSFDEGKKLWTKDEVIVKGDSLEDCEIILKGEKWDLFDCSFESIEELKIYLRVFD